MKKTRQVAGLQVLPTLSRPMLSAPVIMSGTDYLGNISVASAPAEASDKILAVLPISPSEYAGTRVTQMASLWERYRFHKFTVRYIPSVPNTLGCQLICYLDTDPLDDATTITDADQLVRQATAQAGAKQWNFNQTKEIPLAMRADDQLYYTGVDRQNERFTRQGTLYVIQVTEPVSFSGTALTEDITAGSLYVDWRCEFQIPQIEPEAQGSLPTFALTKEIIFSDDASLLYQDGTSTVGTFDLAKPYFQILGVETGAQYSTSAEASDFIFRLQKPNGDTVDVSRSGGVPGVDGFTTEIYADLLFQGASSDNTHFLIGSDAPYGEWTVQVRPDFTSARIVDSAIRIYGYRFSGTKRVSGKVRTFLRGKGKKLSDKPGEEIIVPWSRPETRSHIHY